MYGLTITLAIIVSVFLAERIIRNEGKNTDVFWGAVFWLLALGFVGARLYHVIDRWDIYSQTPVLILQTWRGGMGIVGGLVGGFLGFTMYLKLRQQSMKRWLDVAGLCLPLAQAIGRWGNYFNRELLPYALYESAADMLLFLLLFSIRKRLKELDGLLFLLYLIGYSVIRFSLEGLRIQPWEAGGVNVAGAISAIVFLVSSFIAISLLKAHVREEAVRWFSVSRVLMHILAVVGIAVSLYLTYAKLTSSPIVCGIGNCEKIQASPYSQIFGIPVAVLGILYYLVVFILANKSLHKPLGWWLIFGAVFSAYLTYLELFVINEICMWCVISFADIILMNALYLFGPRRIQSEKAS